MGQKNTAALKKLVLEVDIASQPPSFLLLRQARRTRHRVRLLSPHRDRHPGDFWANHNFGLSQEGRKSQRPSATTPRHCLGPTTLASTSTVQCTPRSARTILDLARRSGDAGPRYGGAQPGPRLQAEGDLVGANAAFARPLAPVETKIGGRASGLASLMRQGDVPALDLPGRRPPSTDRNVALPERGLGRLGMEGGDRLGRGHVGLKSNDAGIQPSGPVLVSCAEVELRNGVRAVEMANKRHELAQPDGFSWNTLGVAHYRAGNWKEAIAALEQSMQLFAGRREAMNTFVLAMVHWQLGNRAEARRWYDKAVAWMNVNEHSEEPLSVYLRRFRAEAADLLGIKGKKD